MNDYGIPYLTVLGRVTKFQSFLDKTTSKSYSNPFGENTDFVGLRVIVYYPTDIDRVLEVIQREFDVIESEDKADSFDVNQFGYRSHHVLVKIKQAWLSTPNYRGLDDIPIEMQLRPC